MSATAEDAAAPSPTGALLARPSSSVGAIYSATGASLDASLAPASIANNGGNQAHDNMQPYTTLSFCIALQGVFPSRN
jgi:microcystin-dependent protein